MSQLESQLSKGPIQMSEQNDQVAEECIQGAIIQNAFKTRRGFQQFLLVVAEMALPVTELRMSGFQVVGTRPEGPSPAHFSSGLPASVGIACWAQGHNPWS